MKLRPYQKELVDKARTAMASGAKSVLMVAPTGAGKTVMFSFICKAAKTKGAKVLILAHRAELLDQISKALTEFKVRHGFIAAGMPYEKRHTVYVASAQTLVRRLDKLDFIPTLIIIDEAHHVAKGNTWYKCMNHYERTLKLGVTATPCRLSGEPLKQAFDVMVQGPTTRTLIDEGFLCGYRYFAPQTGIDLSGLKKIGGDYSAKDLDKRVREVSITGDVLKHYKKLVPDKRAVVFCVTVAHATDITNAFIDDGIPSAVLHASLKKDVRQKLIRKFRSGDIKVLTNVGIISEGFDLPAIDAVILMRPTQSLSLFLQQVGRALRTHKGKDVAYVIDHVGNMKRHGMPCDSRKWSLESKVETSSKEKQEAMLSIKICSKCLGVNLSVNKKCVYCDTAFVSKSDVIKLIDEELEEVLSREQGKKDKAEREKLVEQEKKNVAKARTESELRAIQKKMGYKDGWVYMRIQWLQAKGLFKSE